MSSLCWCWGRCRMVEMTERNAWILSSHSARIFNPYTDWFCLPSAGKVLSSPMYLHALFPVHIRDHNPFLVVTLLPQHLPFSSNTPQK